MALQLLPHMAAGIRGLDELCQCGSPRNWTTWCLGGPGTGKMVFALQARTPTRDREILQLGFRTGGYPLSLGQHGNGGGRAHDSRKPSRTGVVRLRRPRLYAGKRGQRPDYAPKCRQLQFAAAGIVARMAASQFDPERQRAELTLCTIYRETHPASSSKQSVVRNANVPATVAGEPRSARAARISASPARAVGKIRSVARKRAKPSDAGATDIMIVVMRLYVAGRAPNSLKAIANLESICRRHLKDRYELEIVDVCEHPHRAAAAGILLTPSLTKMSPAPTSTVIGNLSDTSTLLAALGIHAGSVE